MLNARISSSDLFVYLSFTCLVDLPPDLQDMTKPYHLVSLEPSPLLMRITITSGLTSDPICTDCDLSSATSEELYTMTFTAYAATSKVYWLPFTPCVLNSPFGLPQDLP